MPFSFSNQGSLVFVRWGKPTMHDLEPVLEHLRRVRRESGPAIAVLFVPEDAAAPEPEVAREMARRFPDLMAECSRVHQVFEGSGFFIGFKRSVLTGMLLASNKLNPPSKRLVVSIHATVDEVAATLAPDQRADLWRLLSEARAA
jgi:hypothetical protein